MKNPVFALTAIVLAVLISSCSQYIVSPLNTTSNPYIPIPVKQTGAPSKTETFAGVGLSPGGMFEDNYNDFFNYGSLRLAQSHAFSFLRASYSGNLMLGATHISQEGGYTDEESIYRSLHGGNLFSGAVGINGTLSFAVPFSSGKGEWRILGIQGSSFNEFGAYQNFREHFPISPNGYIDRKSFYWSAGLFTEFVRVNRNDKFFGFKFALSLSSFPNPWDEEYNGFDDLPAIPHYFAFTPFFGKGNGSGFVQVNFGTAVSSIQMGFLLNLKALTKKTVGTTALK